MKRLILYSLFLTPFLAYAGPDPRGVLELEGFSNSDSTGITSKRGRNDFTIKEPLASGDTLFFVKGFGYNGTDFTSTARAQMTFNASQAWTANNNGADIRFSVTPDGSATMAEAVRISTGSRVGIGTTNPSYTLEVVGSAYFSGGWLPPSLTEAVLKTTTPTVAGLPYYDTTNKAIVVATGTTNAASFGLITDGTAAPTGW